MLSTPDPSFRDPGRGRCTGAEWVIRATQSWWGGTLLFSVSPKDFFLPLLLLRLFPVSDGLPCPASSLHLSPCQLQSPAPGSSAWACGPRADLATGDPTQLLHFPRGDLVSFLISCAACGILVPRL